jgi:hypothetical protein
MRAIRPSFLIKRAARKRERKRGVAQANPKPAIDDVLDALDSLHDRLQLLESQLSEIKLNAYYRTA